MVFVFVAARRSDKKVDNWNDRQRFAHVIGTLGQLSEYIIKLLVGNLDK